MEKERLNKKQIIPLVIGVLTMIILVSSATYAYFKVSIGNTATSTTITGDIGGGTLGTVTLSGGGTNLYLGVTADDMSESKKGTTYYSSTTEGSRETNVNNAGKTTYTATLSGDETDSVMYACDYEFTVTSSGTALGKEHTSDISVVFEGDIKKTIPLSASGTVSGTWFGFKNSNKERSFNAYLQLENKDSEQNSLAGTNLSVEIENTKWNCYLSELDELVGEAYALVVPNGTETLYSREAHDLIFVRSDIPITTNDTYEGKAIKAVYTGFETEMYESKEDKAAPWHEYNADISRILIEAEIRPKSTASWFWEFSGIGVIDFYLSNLNMVLVTDMSGMFDFFECYEVNLYGIENWNTSNVTNMSRMFSIEETDAKISLNLSGWDVSNVKNMSYMFDLSYFFGELTLNLSGWNVSNVTNMSYMFFNDSSDEDQSIKLSGLEEWDTSNVENMASMFYGISLESDLDLSEWDVSKVASYEGFNSNIKGSGTLTPPKWPTTT